METYKLRVLYAGLAVALVVLIIGVVALALHLPYAFSIVGAALAAIGGLIRSISVVLTVERQSSRKIDDEPPALPREASSVIQTTTRQSVPQRRSPLNSLPTKKDIVEPQSVPGVGRSRKRRTGGRR